MACTDLAHAAREGRGTLGAGLLEHEGDAHCVVVWLRTKTRRCTSASIKALAMSRSCAPSP